MSVAEANKPVNVVRFALLLMLLLAVAGRVQAERLPIRTYTTTDGLVGDGINRIVRDSRGFLWFCTSEGLSRFDGYKFTNYGTAQGLPHRTVNDLIETRSGDYWVAVAADLCRFKPDSPQSEARFVVYDLGNDKDYINTLFEDQAGTVWCAKGDGLHRIDRVNDQWTFSIVDLGRPPNSDPNVVSIVEDLHGNLWISTGSGLYRRRKDGTVDRYAEEQGVPRPYGGPLLADREGRIWLGTIGKGLGLYQIVPDPVPNRSVVSRVFTTKDGLGKNYISCMSQSSDGRLWVGSGGNLNEFLPRADRDGRQFRSYASANGIRGVTSIGEDRDGNLWLGTDTNGAMKVASNGFTPFNEADGLGGTRVSQISESAAAELCVFSGGGNGQMFINRFEGGTFTALQLSLPRGIANWSWGWHQNMLEDRMGEWWISTGQGLVRYPKLRSLEQLRETRPRAIYTTHDGLGGNTVFRLFEDSRGDIWVGTIDAGPNSTNRWERSTGKFHPYFKEDGIPPAAPTAFCEDTSGNLWIGFYVGGVARYRDGRFTLFTPADGVPAGFIGALYIDKAGRLWIATTEGGVARVDDPGADRPQFISYTTADGLSSNHATSVTEDHWGRIYVGTGCGLDRLDPVTGHIKHYTTADGLANNYVNVSLRDRSGNLWFGTLDGVSRFIPEPDRPERPPPILINGLRVAGVQQRISELGETNLSGLRLGASQNQLQIDFFAVGFGSGEVLRYRYKLEGADQDWGPWTDQRSVNYANLSPGAYHFLVQAISADGLVSPSPAAVAFTVLPPTWQRWWFVTLVVLFVGLITYSLYSYRVSRLIEIEKVRTRIATDLHDEIGSSLSQIAILSEVAGKRIESSDRAAMTPLARIAYLSRESVDAMSDIVWAINPHKDRLSDLTHRMRHLANEVLTARDIELRFRAPSDDQDTRIDVETRRQVFLIFKEAINNIVRHSGCTETEIDFSLSRSRLVLALHDNGCGFDPEHPQDGHGLKSLRQRADALGGQLEVVSSSTMGTTITLKVARHK